MTPQPRERPVCPTPHKRPFSSKRAAKRSGVGRQKFGRVYLCPCGLHWHVTRRPQINRDRLEPVA